MNGMIWGEYLGIISHYRYETIFGPSRVSSINFNFIAAGIMTTALFLAVYFASNITRRLREREVEIESAYSDLQKVDEEKSYFMRRVSHELRSPLTAVQSYVKVLSEGFSDKVSDRQRDLLNKMDVRLESLVDMVGDLLRFSRLRVLNRPRTVEHFNFEELLRQSCEFYLPWANEKAVNLKVQTEPAPVLAEKEGFRDAVRNLISNAIKYTPEGGEVYVSLKTNNKKASLTVADTGIGIGEKEKEGVFSEFFRASNAKEFTRSGTGLGLAITKRIVEIHGGSIRFESELNKGTRFEVTFPLTKASRRQN
jgi:two-component system phosphate regulon sensor histidine kinase PhoR